MLILDWLIGTFTQEAFVAATAHAGKSIFGSSDESAVGSALTNAVRVAINEVVQAEQQRSFAADVVLEHLERTQVTGIPAGNVLLGLERAVHEALAGLWTSWTEDGVDHATHIGIGCSQDRLTELLASEFVSSLGQHATAQSGLGSMVALLRLNRIDERWRRSPLPNQL